MPARPVIPETALAAVRTYCDNKTPDEHREKMRVEWSVRGKSITIYDCEAPWTPDMGPEWIRVPIAQLRYDPEDELWRLYCADSNSRWHYYDMVEPTRHLVPLLAEIDRDPTGIFWG